MAAADAQAVTVAADGKDGQPRFRHLNARCNRQGPAVNGMQAVCVCKKRVPAGATDAGNRDHLVMRQAQMLNRVVQTLMDTEIPASGTPGREMPGTYEQIFR